MSDATLIKARSVGVHPPGTVQPVRLCDVDWVAADEVVPGANYSIFTLPDDTALCVMPMRGEYVIVQAFCDPE